VADISDVRDYLVGLAASACYPLGTSFPSVTTRQITIAPGWPEPLDVDTAMGAGNSIVSVYPVPGATAKETQVFEPPQIITAPVFGMIAAVSATTPITATISGTPGTNEYLTFVVDGIHAYSSIAGPSDTNLTMATTLAALVAVNYPGTASVSGVVTVIGAHSLAVRIGAPYLAGQLIHRQRQQIRVTVFSPTDADRTTIAKPIDVLFKQNLHLTFPDTSQGIMTYANVIEDDKSQKSTNYRRGLVYDICYGTIDTFTAYSITSVTAPTTEVITGNIVTTIS
jgi:hypothetical protein